jgi:hypothetical protein
LDFVFARPHALKEASEASLGFARTPCLLPSVSKLHQQAPVELADEEVVEGSLLLTKASSASASCQIETRLQAHFNLEAV